LSDALPATLNTRKMRVGNEQGAEAYYSYAVTPWFLLTGDLECIDPPLTTIENAFIAGVRANIRF